MKSFDSELYRQLICYPQEVIPCFDMAANELFFEKYPEGQLPHQIQVRPFNAEKTKNLRHLSPEGKNLNFKNNIKLGVDPGKTWLYFGSPSLNSN